MLLLALVSALAPAHAGSLPLAQAVELAVSRSPDAQLIDGRVREAEGGAGAARSALLPQIVASGTYQHWNEEISFPNFLDPSADDIVIQAQDALAGQVTASQVVFSGGAFARAGAASASARAADATGDAGRAELALRTVQIWVGAWAAQETVGATTTARETAAARVAMAQEALAAGTVTPLTAERAAVALKDAERRVYDATRLRDDLFGQLRLYTGVDATGGLSLADAVVPPAPEGDEEALVSSSLDRRADVRAARAQLDAAKAGRWAVAGDWAPTVVANGAVRTTNSPGFSGATTWYVGGSVSLPVFDGGLRFADGKRVGAQVAQAEAAVARVEAAAGEDVRSALRSLRLSQAVLGVARDQEAIATRARDLADVGYRAGTVTQVEEQDAETALLEARVGRIRAEGGEILARWTLSRATGTLPTAQ